jgi:hypothetical protein
VVSTNSPSSVNSSPRALGAPAACRRDRAGAAPEAAAADGLLAGMSTFHWGSADGGAPSGMSLRVLVPRV